jgi:hypothetical protein
MEGRKLRAAVADAGAIPGLVKLLSSESTEDVLGMAGARALNSLAFKHAGI